MKSLALNGLVVAQGTDWHGHDWDSGWWIVMMLGMVVFWVVVVVAIIWAVRTFAGGHPARSEQKTPLELLDQRLAEGLISVEEYEERRRVLLGSGTGGGEGGAPSSAP